MLFPARLYRTVAGLLLAGMAAAAVGQELRVEVLAAGPQVEAAAVRGGAYDAQFRLAPERPLRLDAVPGGRHWIRLSFDTPRGGDPHDRSRVLHLERVALGRIVAWIPQAGAPPRAYEDGFFGGTARQSLGPDSFAFPLAHHLDGPQRLLLEVQHDARVALTPRLLPDAEFHAGERTAAALIAATYASLGVLLFIAVALFLALRDRVQLRFASLTGSVLLLLTAVNGHLYHWPLGRSFGALHGNGIYALAMLCSALALSFTGSFLARPAASPGAGRLLRGARAGVLAVGAACLLAPAAWSTGVQVLAGGAALAAIGAILALALHAWRGGEALARAYSLVWMLLAAAVAMRLALAHGLLPQNPLTLYGFQLALAFGMVLLSIGLADRVMEFRKQRDRARQARQETEATLQREQARRAFVDGLREQLRQAPAGRDLDWVVLRRLLSSLHEVLPQRGAAVFARDWHGPALLVAEPMEHQARYAALIEARQARLRGLCRMRHPTVTPLDARATDEDPLPAASHASFAVVPLPLAAPAWGGLLVEREEGAEFAAEELQLASEFVALAVRLDEEAASRLDLERRAELDPLTGACNRRAGDALLQQTLRRALAAQQPYALLFVDLDHFKRVNDEHGHAAGDDCLRLAAEAIRARLAPGERLVRYGGEEFLVMAPGRGPDDARALGESIREAVHGLRVRNGSGEIAFTVSIGIAGRLPGEDDPQPILERADRALYAAKRNGRNQVQAAATFGYGKDGQDSAPPPPLSI